MLVEKRYLVLPVDDGAEETQRLTLREGDKIRAELTVRLSGTPRAFMYYDLRDFLGRDLSLSIEPERPFEPRFTDEPDRAGLYAERYRPAAHFSPAWGWMNDPNGLVKVGDTWHLFFQHNPAGTRWGNMHWGHAVSADLVAWRQLEEALYPDETGTMFSGSAVLDEGNVSGLGRDGRAPILLFYTAAGEPFTQRLAFSTDGGKTFSKYGSALVPNLCPGNRDPKVVYCPDAGKWLMALYLTGHEFMLLESENLLSWRQMQRFTLPEDGECPDFYPLTCEGERKWVFTAAHDRYLVGSVRDGCFVPEQEARRLHWGDGYAAQSYFLPGSDRRVRFAWNRSEVPCMPFQCALSTPQEMTLRRAEGLWRLCCLPAAEFTALRGEQVRGVGSLSVPGKAADAELVIPAGKPVEISLRGLRMAVEGDCLRCGEHAVPLTRMEDGCFHLRAVLDAQCAEVYEGYGEHTLCAGHLWDGDEEIRCEGVRLTAWPLRDIHEPCIL